MINALKWLFSNERTENHSHTHGWGLYFRSLDDYSRYIENLKNTKIYLDDRMITIYHHAYQTKSLENFAASMLALFDMDVHQCKEFLWTDKNAITKGAFRHLSNLIEDESFKKRIRFEHSPANTVFRFKKKDFIQWDSPKYRQSEVIKSAFSLYSVDVHWEKKGKTHCSSLKRYSCGNIVEKDNRFILEYAQNEFISCETLIEAEKKFIQLLPASIYYQNMANTFKSEKAASLELSRYGIPGIYFYNQYDKLHPYNYVVFDEQMPLIQDYVRN